MKETEKLRGEYVPRHHMLSYIRQYLPENPIILEAGAFNGKDTQKISTFWPRGQIHCFEPVPEIFVQLEHNTHHLENVHRYNVALSNQIGTAHFYLSQSPRKPNIPFQSGTLHKPTGRLAWSPVQYPRTTQVPTTTIDSWAQQQTISHIDFMWLDMQGHELHALQAAPTILTHTRVIHMEVNFVPAYENQPLYDEIISWLEQNDFQLIARDFKDQTGWFFGNAVFVKN